MSIKYTREQLMGFSNEEITEKTSGKAVDFHLNNGWWEQLCVNDLQGSDREGDCFYTRTGIHISLNDIDYVEVFL